MPRALWKGAISFGLVNIPVQLMTAKEQKDVSFHMIDSSDNSPIGYKKINKKTGKEVSAKKIVKGYEYERGQYVIMKDSDFEKANPKATQTIDIQNFVNTADIDLLMFEKPYYLVPDKAGTKGYVLLRKVLEETEKAAIAQFVMHNKQHLVALIPRENFIILETLRYASEVREVEEAEYLDKKQIDKIKISAQELKMAESLVSGMTSEWDPSQYKNTYQDDLHKLINKKIKNGDVEEVEQVDDEESDDGKNNVFDLMPLLEKSLAASGHGAHRKSTNKTTAKSSRKTPAETKLKRAKSTAKKASRQTKGRKAQ